MIALQEEIPAGDGEAPGIAVHREQIQQTAQVHLTEYGKSLEIPEENRHLVYGRPETEIHNVAREIGADLIVVGSHGRNGLALLLGSTSTGVLHGAVCDVLAVRVGLEEAKE